MLRFLDKCQRAYYEEGESIISDAEFDYLSKKYNYAKVGSLTNTTNSKGKHLYQLFSLQKVFDDEDSPIDSHTPQIETPKLDGAAISLKYADGVLIQVLTRGDGIEGVDITNKILESNIVPLVVGHKKVFQITGEVVANKSIPNARNYAAGALNLKDIKEFLERDLTFIAYGVFPYITDFYVDDIKILKAYGFNTVLDGDWPQFPQDGKVYRVVDNKQFDRLGFTSKHPRGAYARKLSSDTEIKETVLLDVIWQTGGSGRVTPVAILDPVILDDAEVKRATLNNPGFIEDMGLEIGDIVLVVRSGGIIPKILGKAK